MNAIVYIDNLTDYTANAQESFNEYNKQYPGVCKFDYYRTKYNNKKRELDLSVAIRISTPTTENTETVELKPKKEITLKAHNYTDKDVSGLIPETIPTGTLFDRIISDNGFCRKCVDAVAAKAGSGKTWSRMSLAAKAVLHSNHEVKAALLSAEMLEHEIAREVRSSPELNNIDFVYLVDYFKDNVTAQQYWYILEECFKKYDLLIIDSFSVVHDQLLELYEGRMKSKKLIFMLTDHLTKWAAKYNCNVQLILQCKRDGTYLGSSALVHAISSLCYVHVFGQKRFNMFEKNRNNGTSVNREVFFSKSKDGSIIMDEESYAAAYERIEDTKTDIKQFLENLKNRKEENQIEESVQNDLNKPTENIDNQVDLLDMIEEVEQELTTNLD
jgi:predicted ATP-dependent serine protease